VGLGRSLARVSAVAGALLAFAAGCGSLIGLHDITPPPGEGGIDAGVEDAAAACPASADASPISKHTCASGASCWLNPAPQGTNLFDVWAVGCGDAWAVGQGGTLMHWDGSTWTSQVSGVAADLSRVSGTSGSDVWFTGDLGTLLHWDGQTVTPFSYDSTTELVDALWASARNDVWAGGADGSFIHWDGTAWTHAADVEAFKTEIRAVWGSAPNDVWAVGKAGEALHWDGARWSEQKPVTATTLGAVWGSASNDVWALGNDESSASTASFVFHWDGTAWSVQKGIFADGESAVDVWGTSSSDVWMMGDEALHHFDGTSWNTVGKETVLDTAGDPSSTKAMAGTSLGQGQTLLVGRAGGLFHGNDEQFTRLDTGPRDSIVGISGTASSDITLATSTGDILAWDGTQLTRSTISDAQDLNAIWVATMGTATFVAGDGSDGKPAVWRWRSDDPTYKKMTSPPSDAIIFGFVAFSEDPPLWVVGADSNGPLVLRYESGVSLIDATTPVTRVDVQLTPSIIQSGAVLALTAISGSGPTDIWAASQSGYVAHWDGAAWKMSDTGTNATLYSIVAIAQNDVWAAGRYDLFSDAVIHFDGTSWKKIDPPPPTTCLPDPFVACVGRQLIGAQQGMPGPFFSSMTGASYHWDPMKKAWSLAAPAVVDNFAFFVTPDSTAPATLWSGGSSGEIRFVTPP
jgi:hypothetical protein